jgi:hypothetical protein
MSAVDQLLVLLLEGAGSYFTKMLSAGFTEDRSKTPSTRQKSGLHRVDGFGGGPLDRGQEGSGRKGRISLPL